MAYDIPGLIRSIKSFDSRLLARFAPEFGSEVRDHRLKIRHSIRDELGVLSEPERGRLLDLDEVPDLEDWSVSISHCARLGGWIAAPLPVRVGLDIEVKDRIHGKLLERIAQPGELVKVPDPALLWCAKESCFKALADDQPVAMSQLRIEHWSARPDGAWDFSCGELRGAVFSAVDLLISVSVL